MKFKKLLEELSGKVTNYFVDECGYVVICVSSLDWSEIMAIKDPILQINPKSDKEIELVFDSTLTID